MSLEDVRKAAKKMMDRDDGVRKRLIDIGFRPDGVNQLFDGRRDFLNGILNTEPPPDVKKVLEESE